MKQSFLPTPLLLAALLLAGLVTGLRAQPLQIPSIDCIGGTLYYVSFPDTVENAQDARFPPRYSEKTGVMIFSQTDQDVTLSLGQVVKKVHIAAGTFAEVSFDETFSSGAYHTLLNQVMKKGVRISAPSPIVVYASTSTHFGAAAFTPQPVEAWGLDYFVAAWEGDVVRNIYPAGETNFDAHEKREAPAEILIVAAYDNTSVVIRPTGFLASCSACTTVKLNAGETYLIQSRVDTSDDAERQSEIAGTGISANKPIGVITGNTRTQIEPFRITTLGGNSFKDLALEWMRPTSQHGTGFVFMPTWDEYHQGRRGSEVEREAEFVRIYGTRDTTLQASMLDSDGNSIPTAREFLNEGEFTHERIGDASVARYFSTTAEAMAFQSPQSIAKFRGTTGSGNFIGAAFDAWGTYMVEMMPREAWTNIAPFQTGFLPTGGKHYINVVTDTGNQYNIYIKQESSPPTLMPFNRGRIAGTDLVWGSVSLNDGVGYILYGANNARFGGFVYGTWKGYELYRPGAAGDGGDGKGDALASGAHPAEYEEIIAQMYGYPLPASICRSSQPTSGFSVRATEGDCGVITYDIAGVDSGTYLKYIRFDVDSTYNARLELVQPRTFDSLQQGIDHVIIRVVPVDPSKPAAGAIEFTDRSGSGEIQKIYYRYEPNVIDPSPSVLTFQGGSGDGGQTVLLRNNRSVGVTVRDIWLASGNEGFRIRGIRPTRAWSDTRFVSQTIQPGDSLIVDLAFTGNTSGAAHDSLLIDYGCFRRSVLLSSDVAAPCLRISNVSFGDVELGKTVTRTMEICNVGGGVITFAADSSSSLVSWLMNEFFISQAELDKLRNSELGPDECVTIQVSFRSLEVAGRFQTVATINASTTNCGDTALWSANVVEGPLSVEDGAGRSASQILSVIPNPTTGATRIGLHLATGGDVTATLIDVRGREVQTLYQGDLSAGDTYLNSDLSHLPAGTYYLRIASGTWEELRPISIVR